MFKIFEKNVWGKTEDHLKPVELMLTGIMKSNNSFQHL